MATAKTVALAANPVTPASAPMKTATKAITAKPAVKKQLAAGKSSAKRLTVKKPLSQAFANSKTPRNVEPIKPVKPKKPKLVRDSFTIPASTRAADALLLPGMSSHRLLNRIIGPSFVRTNTGSLAEICHRVRHSKLVIPLRFECARKGSQLMLNSTARPSGFGPHAIGGRI